MTIDMFFTIFTQPFVLRAVAVGGLISICAALLGVVLVLKKYSLIGHGLADVGFASVALALALGVNPLYISLPVVLIASFIIMAVSQKKGVSGDTAIGIAATTSLAIGIMITYLGNGFNADISDYMFGSILAVTTTDIIMSLILCAIVIVVYILFYNRIFIITCDESFAKASGINVSMYRFLISFLTALTIVMGMRMMGSLLISSLIIFPAVTARNFASSFKSLVITSGICSVICFLIGIVLTILFKLPTGAGIVVVNAVAMIISSIYGKIKKG